jgi:hypothetical protein
MFWRVVILISYRKTENIIMNEFKAVSQELLLLVEEWEPKFLFLSNSIIHERRNSQNRTIKQILGHLIDSASNNIHRIVHLQYEPSPLIFPDYAHFGNNDRWIAIQNYQEENWTDMVQLWKYINLHFAHIIQHINVEKLENEWISATNENISLQKMIADYPRHFKMHCREIHELINNSEIPTNSKSY